MKVRATRLGYYNHKRQRDGEVFDLHSPQDYSKRWMEPVCNQAKKHVESLDKKPEAPAAKKEVKKNVKAEPEVQETPVQA